MSEIKRVALNTLETQKVSDKVIKKVIKTVRITLVLPESNEDEYPEYNYKDELAAAVKKKVKPAKDSNCVENGLDPFGENDDDVRRIALEMEAKYGSGVTKKKRKGRKDDYADIGMGYDESDPFIDNTDGYDEIIPQNVTTLHGGFYVNSGALVFKTDDEASSNASSSDSSSSDASSSSESEGEEKQKPKNRKRILESSADSDSNTANPAQKEKKPKVQPSAATTMHQAIQKKLFSTNKIQVKKRRLIDPLKKTVKDLLREKREDLNMTVPDELKTVEDNIEKESSKENKKPMSITSVTDAIESVVKKVVQEVELDNTNKDQSKSPSDVSQNAILNQSKNDSQQSQSKEKDKPTLTRLEKEEIVKLPENLPAEIEDLVSKLKEAALNYKGEGKKAFFTKEVNAILLNIEKRSKSISKSSRVKVYEHLSQYVNCTKDTLTRRARVLDLEDNERRLLNLETKLKDSISAIMPALEEKFNLESQKVLQKKFSGGGENSEDFKNLKMPRRKFTWTEETKKFLKDIVSVKKRCLILEGKSKDSLLEEQLVEYLRKQILPLWPEGWMYVNNVKKVLNSMQDNSKSSVPSSSLSSASIKAPKHSNISITPVTNGKSSAEKPEITNSLTVTKIVNNSDVVDSVKTSSKNLDLNHIISDITIIKEKEEKSNSSSHKDLEITSKHARINENLPNVEPKELPSDLSIHPKKNDMLSIHPKKNDVIDLAADDSQLLEVNKVNPELGKPLTYQKAPKQNEMFKPYADEVISIERSIPDKATFEEHRLSHAEIIPQISQHVDHSYPNKEKLSNQSPFSEKGKPSAAINLEKEKYTTHMYPMVDEHIPQSYTERDKRSPQSTVEKEKLANPEKEIHSSDKHSSVTYPEKDKHNSHKYLDKEKHIDHGYADKDKHASHSYSDKDKHTSHGYLEKDRHTSHIYSEKDKSISHGYTEKEKDKRSSHGYLEKDKHIYSEKDKNVAHVYAEKDKDKHSAHGYLDKDKHISHGHTEKDKDKHSSHGYLEKDKHSSRGYSEKEKHGSHSYSKDKHSSHGYSDKDKHSSHSYSSRDKHSSQSYSEKEKVSTHAFSVPDTYIDKEKQSSHSYSTKDKHTSHSYSDKERHISHSYPDKDKHVSHSYQPYSDKDRHASHSYTERDKHVSFKKYEEKLILHQERSNRVDSEKPANLTKPVDKPTDLSKFQMFKPYSETPKAHMDDVPYKPKDHSKHHQIADYKAKEDKHHRPVDIPKSIPQEASNFTTKAFTTPSDFLSSRYDVSSSKHRATNAQTFQGANMSNDISQVKEDNGVIVKNLQTKDPTREDHHNPVIPKPAHCQTVKRKLLETYSRNPAEMTTPNYYPLAPNKHTEYSTSSPLVTKSEGDGQKDIQMVMENLKALQKLSCSPIKNDSTGSSPVSVIAYNKNFPSSKTSTSNHGLSRNDMNSRGDFTGGFQDEFQKQFINSLQQMAANANNNKSGYNNGS